MRELLQNSLDAVRERRLMYQDSGGSDANSWDPLDPQFADADVIIAVCRRECTTPSVDEGGPPSHWNRWIEVRDRGIGMTAETVRDYFLKAGASYRRSDAWLRAFADGDGRSRVLRSGRFGVGALAAFLIGDELQLITKHLSSKGAVAFESRLTDELVELRKADHAIGTTVRACLDGGEDTFSSEYRIDWDWYRLSDPKITRLFYGEEVDKDDEQTPLNATFLPSEGAPLPATWRRITDEQFSDVQWTYLDDHAPAIACNGICIKESRNEGTLRWHSLESNGKQWSSARTTEQALQLQIPNISVFDPDGHLPLNLARNALTSDTLPFSEPLLESVIRDLLAYALVCGPTAPLRGHNHAKHRKLCYPGHTHDRYRVACTPWLSLRDGFTLTDLGMLTWAGVRRCIALIARHKCRALPVPRIDGETAVIGFANNLNDDSYKDYEWPLPRRWPDVWVPRGRENPLADDHAWTGCRVVVSRYIARFMERRHGELLNDQVAEDVPANSEESQMREICDGRFILLESSHNLPPLTESSLPGMAQSLLKRRRVKSAGIFAEWYLSPKFEVPVDNAIVSMWRHILTKPVIHYDPAKRLETFPRAFQELRPEIEAWHAVVDEQQSERRATSVNTAGGFPEFTHANQIKQYLRQNGVRVSIKAHKITLPLIADVGRHFRVFLDLTREELKGLNPTAPNEGDPFDGVEYNYELLPDFSLTQQLLQGSNASFAGVLSPHEEA